MPNTDNDCPGLRAGKTSAGQRVCTRFFNSPAQWLARGAEAGASTETCLRVVSAQPRHQIEISRVGKEKGVAHTWSVQPWPLRLLLRASLRTSAPMRRHAHGTSDSINDRRTAPSRERQHRSIISRAIHQKTAGVGYAQYLFHDIRRTDAGTSSNFSLNDPKFETAQILFAGANFGSGSSREGAVYALYDSSFEPSSRQASEILRQTASKMVSLPPDCIEDPIYSRGIGLRSRAKVSIDIDRESMHTGRPGS